MDGNYGWLFSIFSQFHCIYGCHSYVDLGRTHTTHVHISWMSASCMKFALKVPLLRVSFFVSHSLAKCSYEIYYSNFLCCTIRCMHLMLAFVIKLVLNVLNPSSNMMVRCTEKAETKKNVWIEWIGDKSHIAANHFVGERKQQHQMLIVLTL